MLADDHLANAAGGRPPPEAGGTDRLVGRPLELAELEQALAEVPSSIGPVRLLQRLVELGQYLSGDYRQQVTDLGMRQSVGRTGVCWDNAVAESFWSSLKRELVHRYRFATRAEARRAIVAWLHRYNHARLHSSLGYIPPLQWENQYRQPQADQAA